MKFGLDTAWPAYLYRTAPEQEIARRGHLISSAMLAWKTGLSVMVHDPEDGSGTAVRTSHRETTW